MLTLGKYSEIKKKCRRRGRQHEIVWTKRKYDEKKDLIKIGSVNIVRTMLVLCVCVLKNVEIFILQNILYSNMHSTHTHMRCVC